jgi:transcriptional regulator with XRE-family HTH domain
MEGKEFSQIRHYLGKSQSQLARILCVSPKAIQSYEQGLRHIPIYIERQILLFQSL